VDEQISLILMTAIWYALVAGREPAWSVCAGD
jgi:hypothetical protein